ncbi:MAG: hypothetical protein M1812_004219 [Candelaria pacifica]|nr:MAG: hypothetical protein M1812_004219 [Candelaria pacifica]
MANPNSDGCGEASTSNPQSKPIVLDDSSKWPIKPKSVNSWDVGSEQSHLFYLTENQQQPPHLVPQSGQAVSIASQDVAKWVANNSPHSSIEDNGAVYEALFEVYGVLMETSAGFRHHMIQRADQHIQGKPREKIDELHDTWVQDQEKRVTENLHHVYSAGEPNSQSDDLVSGLPHAKSEAITSDEHSNAKGKTKLKQPEEQNTVIAQEIEYNPQQTIINTSPLEIDPAKPEILYLFNDRYNRKHNIVPKENPNPAPTNHENVATNHRHGNDITNWSPDMREYMASPSERPAVNHKYVRLSESAIATIEARGLAILENSKHGHTEGSVQGPQRTEAIKSTTLSTKENAATHDGKELSPKSPLIIISGHGNIINITCASDRASICSSGGEVVDTNVAINSYEKAFSAKDVQLPSSVPTHSSDWKSSGTHTEKLANLNATWTSLSSNRSSRSSLHTLRRRTECEDLSAAASYVPPHLRGPLAPRASENVQLAEETAESPSHANLPIPQLAAQNRNVSPSQDQISGTTDPIKRRSTRAAPPPPINTTASGFYKPSTTTKHGTRPSYFSPEYPISSNPSLQNSPRTPNMAAYPALLGRSQASLTRRAAPPPLGPTNPPNTDDSQPVFTEAGLAAAIADELPTGISPNRYMQELNTRVLSLEMEKAHAVGRMVDDQSKIENLETEVETLKAKLTWYELEWKRLADDGDEDDGA